MKIQPLSYAVQTSALLCVALSISLISACKEPPSPSESNYISPPKAAPKHFAPPPRGAPRNSIPPTTNAFNDLESVIYANLRYTVYKPISIKCFGNNPGEWKPMCDFRRDKGYQAFLTSLKGGVFKATKLSKYASRVGIDLDVRVGGKADGLRFGAGPLARKVDHELRGLVQRFESLFVVKYDTNGSPNYKLACLRALTLLDQARPDIEKPIREIRGMPNRKGNVIFSLNCKEVSEVGPEHRGAELEMGLRITTPQVNEGMFRQAFAELGGWEVR